MFWDSRFHNPAAASLCALAASACAGTLREVVVTDVTVVRESHLPNAQGLAGGQRGLLRPGCAHNGLLVPGASLSLSQALGTAAPAGYTGSGAPPARRRGRKGRTC